MRARWVGRGAAACTVQPTQAHATLLRLGHPNTHTHARAPRCPQSALFALAVSDVLMVNMWSFEIGREHGSGKPLLRTIFQVGGGAAVWGGSGPGVRQ